MPTNDGKGDPVLKVAIDSWVLSSRLRYQGTYVYARNLIGEFKRIAASGGDVRFCLFTSRRAANDANTIAAGHNFDLREARSLAHDRVWRLGAAGLAAARSDADLVFAPTASTVPTGRVPFVSTIHDVTPRLMPSHAKRVTMLQRFLLWSAAKFSRAIITDSECSKRDLINLYGLPESKVSVVYLGYDSAVFNGASGNLESQARLLKTLGISKPYLLHHGTIQPRKNLRRLIEAYRLLLERKRSLDLDLVLAGPLGWEYEQTVAAANNGGGNRGRVVLPGALTDADLATLIKGASLVVVPSLYEGFCLPMVEAMASGAPTVAAKASCLPEVSGGVLKYFDPESVEDMASCLQQVLESEATRMELAQKGKSRAGYFSWQRCAEETLAVLRKYGAS
jgi:glycosyltransferase involved in cell wall biosynthesis